MYAKLKSDGQIQVAPKVLRIVVSNPTPERLKYEGYKEVIETDPPEYDPETQRIESHYMEDGENILQVWEVIELPVEEVEEPEQYLEIVG